MNRRKQVLSAMLSISLVFPLFSGIFASPVSAAANNVDVWVTTGDKSKLMSQEPSIAFSSEGETSPYTIHVDEETTYQEMEGFGAAMTDSSAWLFEKALTKSAGDKVMEQLFDPEKGIGFSYVRLPMGSSDFARTHYTYNDTANNVPDPSLSGFTIQHDEEYIIPALKKALSLNPELKIMGSPWSAPAWMKDNKSLFKGKLLPEYYEAYAQYFVKFIQAYAAEGIPIDAVTLQNEPEHEAGDYASMRMDPVDQAAFVKDHLGPAFKAANIDTKIIVWDHNWDRPEYPIEVLNDEAAKAYIAGSAFHGYAGNVVNQAQVHDAHPDKDIYFTESSGGDFAPVFAGNLVWDVQNLIIGATRNWAKTSLKWNLALDEEHGPRVGGCKDCRGVVTVDKNVQTVTSLNEEYYAFGHASKFVRQGAVRIKSNTFGNGAIENVAFKNRDGSKALIVLNSSESEREFKVQWGDQSFRYALPAQSVATFTWEGTPQGESGVNPYSKVEAEDYSDSQGVKTGTAVDTGGGSYITPAANPTTDSYAVFHGATFVDGTMTLKARVSAEQDATVEFRLDAPDGPLLSQVHVTGTGAKETWTTKNALVEGASGTHTLYAVLKGSIKLNWFQFSFDHYKDSFNYLAYNGGFEEGSLNGWQEETPEGQNSAHKVETGDARTGEYKLTHWASDAYEQTSYRKVNVPNGTYKASLWIRKGDHIKIKLFARNYGGQEVSVTSDSGFIGDYQKVTLERIRVTNGQMEVGILSTASQSDWATFDDMELYPVTTNAPAGDGSLGNLAAPTGVSAVLSSSKYDAELRWEQVEGADGYIIYRSVKPISEAAIRDNKYVNFTEAGLTAKDELSFSDAGLRGEQTYYYVVTAYTNTEESAISSEVSVSTAQGQDQVAPAAPTGLTVEPSLEQVKLRWDIHQERDFQRYEVYQDGVRVASVEPVTETWTMVKNLVPGVTYSFTVKAVDQAGNESAPSEAVTSSPLASGIPLSFDNMGFEKGTTEGWSEWHPEGQALAQSVDNDGPRGAYKLTHWGANDYQQSTYRKVQVPNGKYKVQVWVRTGGGQNKLQLQVKNFGGDERTQDLRKAEGGKWTPFSIDNIQVTNGQLELGVFSDAKGGNWTAIDDFEIYSYAPVAPTGLIGIGGNETASLSWTKNTEYDLASYRIYQDGELIADNVKGSSYTIEGLTNEKEYTFTVSALDTDENESFVSDPYVITPRVPVFIENAGFESGDFTGWSSWNESGNAQYIDNDGPHTGQYKLTHWADTDYQQNTYRKVDIPGSTANANISDTPASVTSVTYDTYQASVWVRTGSALKDLRMEVKGYGGDDISVDLSAASSSEWTLFVSKPFQVTSGIVEIGLFTNAKGGNWTAYDDVQLIRVNEQAVIPVTGVTVSPNQLSLNLDSAKTGVLTVKITPADASNTAVVWSSSNESVATVSAGVVTAVGEGEAEITVQTTDGGFHASAHITVTKNNPDPGPVDPNPTPNPGSKPEPGTSDPSGISKPVLNFSGNQAILMNVIGAQETSETGDKVSVVEVSTEILAQATAHAKLKELTMDLSTVSSSTSIRTKWPVAALRELLKTHPDLTLSIKREQETVRILLSTIVTSDLKAGEGSQLLIDMGTAEPLHKPLDLWIKEQNRNLVKAWSPFTIKVQTGNQFIELPKSSKIMLSREMNLPSTAKLSSLTAISLQVKEGKAHFVPVQFIKNKDGQASALLNIQTKEFSRDVYALIETKPIIFRDMNGHWAKSSVDALAERGIVQGTTGERYAPKAEVTRAEWVTLLVRVLGLTGTEDSAQAAAFSDVSASAWYTEAIQAATEAKLIQGFGDGSFKPEANVTREQMTVTLAKGIALLQEQQRMEGKQESINSIPNSFKDAQEVSPWAVSAYVELIAAGLIQGDQNGQLNPTGYATRAEAAILIHHMLLGNNIIIQ